MLRKARTVTFWLDTAPPLLYAHRGASSERPENTAPAFRRALELGADVLELDVHPSSDGVFVVSHDPTAERSCGVKRSLAGCAWSEIATWDAGFGFVEAHGERPFAGTGVRLSRFEDVLDEFPSVALNVDVKDAREHELHALVALIRARGAAGRVLLTSFSWRCLRRIRRARYDGALGLSQLDAARLYFAPAFVGRWLPFGGVRAQIPVRSGPLDLARQGFIEKCHALGLGVDYWVVNERPLAELLLERGADGIISDDVAAMAAVFGSSPRCEAWRARHPTASRSP